MKAKRKRTLQQIKRRKKARRKLQEITPSLIVAAVAVCVSIAVLVYSENEVAQTQEMTTHRFDDVSDMVKEVQQEEPQIKKEEPQEEQESFVLYTIPEEYQRTGGTLPADFQEHLQEVCKSYGVEYAVALAMIETESSYKPDAKGKAGDYGYFQIVEKYHKDRMKKLGISSIDDPKNNATIAIDCLAQYIERFESVDKALTAYNHGVTGAYRDVWTKTGEEQSEYSKKVLKKAARIRKELAAVGDAEEQ